MGDGSVEAVSKEATKEIARFRAESPGASIADQAMSAPLLKHPERTRVAGFNWQHEVTRMVGIPTADQDRRQGQLRPEIQGTLRSGDK